MTRGPSLNTERSYHGCERLNDESIIVSGGLNTGVLTSTEILKRGELEWKNGPDLKGRVVGNELVKSERNRYVAYNLGGLNITGDGETFSTIHGLHRETNEWQLIGSMKEPREWGSAINVPSTMIPWC